MDKIQIKSELHNGDKDQKQRDWVFRAEKWCKRKRGGRVMLMSLRAAKNSRDVSLYAASADKKYLKKKRCKLRMRDERKCLRPNSGSINSKEDKEETTRDGWWWCQRDGEQTKDIKWLCHQWEILPWKRETAQATEIDDDDDEMLRNNGSFPWWHWPLLCLCCMIAAFLPVFSPACLYLQRTVYLSDFLPQ